MTFKEWLSFVLDKKLICERYLPAVDAARSRKQYMDIALDVNGMAFLCDTAASGRGLPYDTMCAEFGPYLNGRYIGSKNSTDNAYTSSLYCSMDDPSGITINTTLTGFFNCHCDVNVPKNKVCQLYVDNASNVNVIVPDDGKCYVDVWGGGVVRFSSPDKVVVKRRETKNEQV